jgi:hypothetical protein
MSGLDVVVVGACAGFSSPPQAAIPSVHIKAMYDFFISSSRCCGALRNTRASAATAEREQRIEGRCRCFSGAADARRVRVRHDVERVRGIDRLLSPT